ncbi:MAG: hypothetical protein JWM53_7095 [bacterium]|nr:hypothetical protein [bacterium]
MRPAILLLALALALGACSGSGGSDPPSLADPRLIGELTLHELFPPNWTHAWAVFLDPSGPLPPANADAALTMVPKTTPAVGQCELITESTCTIQCPADTVCHWGSCANAKPLPLVDAGLVHVTGGMGPSSPMSLAFAPPFGIYESTPPPGPAYLFAGGEILDISFDGGGPIPPIQTKLETPVWLDVTAPDLRAVHLPKAGALHVAWNGVHRTAIEFVLVVSSNTSGASVIVRCTLEDTGTFDLAPELIAQVPPPPRSVHLELSRLTRQLAPAGSNRSVLLHGGFTVAGNGTD